MPAAPVKPLASESYPSASAVHQAFAVPHRPPVPESQDKIPLGYILASAFFLVVALVGFGLYLAIEVISL
jgi:hypothetical protein